MSLLMFLSSTDGWFGFSLLWLATKGLHTAVGPNQNHAQGCYTCIQLLNITTRNTKCASEPKVYLRIGKKKKKEKKNTMELAFFTCPRCLWFELYRIADNKNLSVKSPIKA